MKGKIVNPDDEDVCLECNHLWDLQYSIHIVFEKPIEVSNEVATSIRNIAELMNNKKDNTMKIHQVYIPVDGKRMDILVTELSGNVSPQDIFYEVLKILKNTGIDISENIRASFVHTYFPEKHKEILEKWLEYKYSLIS